MTESRGLTESVIGRVELESDRPTPAAMVGAAAPAPSAGLQLNGTDRRLARAASIADLRLLARRRAPRAVFDYTDGAAGEEIGLRRSRRGLRPGRVPAPGAAGRLRRGHVDDDPRSAVGAAARLRAHRLHPDDAHRGRAGGRPGGGRVGIPYALSTMGTTSIEDLAAEAPAAGCGSSSTSGATARPAGTSSRGPRRRATRRWCSPSTPPFRARGCATSATA